MSLRIRRGTESQRLGFTPDLGEIIWTTNGEKLYVGDGVTPGGKNIGAQLAGVGLTFNGTTGKLDSSASFTTDQIAEGVNNKYFSSELAQDAVASALVTGVHSGISFVYNTTQDTANRIDATVSLSLDNLSDVVISGTPSNGQVLKYNTSTSRWEAGADIDTDTGILAVVDDTTPQLGGNLDLNSYTINGTGNININGTIAANSGLGADLDLNSNDITGTGNINIVGNITASNSISIDGVLTIEGYTIRQPIPNIDRSIFVKNDAEGLMKFVGLTSNDKSANLYIDVSRGTLAAPTNTTAGDSLGGITFTAYHTGAFRTVGAMKMNWSPSAVLGGDVGDATLTIGLNTNSGNFVFANFDHTGTFSVPVLRTGVYTASPETRPTGVKGMIIFNDTTGKFQGFNGTTWVDLN